MSPLPQNTHLRILLITFYVVLGAGLGWLFFHYVLGILMPFVLAYLLAWMLQPIIRFLTRRLHIHRHIAAALSVVTAAGLVGTGAILGIRKLVQELIGLSGSLLDAVHNLPDILSTFHQRITQLLDFLPDNILDSISSLSALLMSSLTKLEIPPSFSSGAFELATGTAKAVPNVLIFCVVFLVSAYFIAADKERIDRTLYALLPNGLKQMLSSTRRHVAVTLLRYLRAQLILMGITFLELFIGFLVLRLDYALAVALLIAVIDALPILGTGTVLIPWGLYSLIAGDYRLGVGCLALYAIILIVRQVLEPKIVGDSIGLHPLVTLMSMYIGLKLLGFVGMILGPVTVILLFFFFQSGYLHIPSPPAKGSTQE